jgi:hypothetical protein
VCYASPVMLRGRCSCAISDRPTPLPRAIFAKGQTSFAPPSSLHPLSPLFPLHPRNAPVTPLFPLLTQKQGGGGVSFASITSFPLATRHCFENSAPICRLSAVNCEPVFLRPAFTTTSIDIVGAPTVPFLHASARSQERSPSPTRSGRAPGGPFQPSTFNFQPFFSPNPNHSRTYARVTCKSNHSRTYAKTGGGGMLTTSSSAIVGAPTFPFLYATKDKPKNRSRKAGSATTQTGLRPASPTGSG